MKPILKIFMTNSCSGCEEAHAIATRVKQEYADLLMVELIDIMDETAVVPEAVFATPTYMLNDRIVSLGNPSAKEVDSWVEEAQSVVQPES